MARDYFKKMRSGVKRSADDAPADPDRVNPWEDLPTMRLADLGAPCGDEPSQRSVAYADWAQRMQDKRTRTQARIHGTDQAAEATTYWTTDALFAESKRVDEEELTERPNPWRVQELLAVLDLREDASKDEVGVAYKKLAKTHHPDRFALADENTQAYHADRMMSINKAYRALRQLERA